MDAEFSTGDMPMAESGTGSTGSVGGVAERVKKKTARRFSRGVAIDPLFCPEHVVDPFDTLEWDFRVAAIKGESGEVLFEQPDCEVPSHWSQLAVNVVCSKYFYGEVGTPQRERSVRQLIHRVSRTIADWGIHDGYFATEEDGERFYRELTWLCLHQHGAFNSPVWFNVGLYHQYGVKGAQCNWHWDAEATEVKQPENPYEYPQGSACFIQSVGDNMEDIMELARSEAMLFKFGSGTGTDLSTLRSHRERLSGGGRPSGPLSFMRVYDQIAAVVKSGGKTRRAAKMQSIKVWHPDVMEFIECKAKEEKKARILIQNGYESNFNGEAYSSILFQNANLSVRVTEEFMQAVVEDKPWSTHWVTDDSQGRSDLPGPRRAGQDGRRRLVLRRSRRAVRHDDQPLAHLPELGPDQRLESVLGIHVPGRHGLQPGEHQPDEVPSRRRLVRHRTLPGRLPHLLHRPGNPGRPRQLSDQANRREQPSLPSVGVGLLEPGQPDHVERPGVRFARGCGLCGAMTALLHGAANLTSAELAAAVGPFDGFAENREPMLGVMQMHRDAVEAIDDACPTYLKDAARGLWEEVLENGRLYGFRNAQATVLAPTGTISFLMDCDTTGIEPDIALVKYKQLAGGGMLKIVNNTVPLALKTLGYDQPEIESILGYIDTRGHDRRRRRSAGRAPAGLRLRFQPRNGTRSIPWRAHVRMMAAAQPFLSGAISKTVNMPRDTTPADVADAYLEGWRLGLKALAVYRDGSKESQPLSTSTEGGKAAEKLKAAPRRERLPDTRQSVTHKFNVAGHEGYITVGLYEDGRPGEMFITHGQGRQHHRRLDGLLRHGRVDELAVRRAAGSVGEQVLAYPLRADGPYQEPGHPHRQEHCGLHLPLAGHHVPARLSRSERRVAGAGRTGFRQGAFRGGSAGGL